MFAKKIQLADKLNTRHKHQRVTVSANVWLGRRDVMEGELFGSYISYYSELKFRDFFLAFEYYARSVAYKN